MKKYSHHRIRLYLGFLILGAVITVISFIVFTISLIIQIPFLQITLPLGLSFAGYCVGMAMIFAYEEIQRWCSRGEVLDRCDYGIVGKDENAVKWKAIPLIDPWKQKGERQVSRAFAGKSNGQSKVIGMDGGKGDGFHGGIYCWVREKLVEMDVNGKKLKLWQPYQAWSVQKGILPDTYIDGKTTEQILADLERDDPLIKTGDKSWLSPYLFTPKNVIKPDPIKGIQGQTEIPLQVAELMWDDPDWRNYSPVLWAYDVKTMFGGAGSKLSSADQFRLAALEDETREKTIALNRAQEDVARISNIASSRLLSEREVVKQGLNR